MKKMLSILCSLIFVLCFAFSALAATMDHWDYTISGSFTNTSFSNARNKGAMYTSPTYLTWGTADKKKWWSYTDNSHKRSSLEINTGAGSTTSNSAVALTHINNAIDSTYKSLTGGSLALDINLQNFNGATVENGLFTYELDFTFDETLNGKYNSSSNNDIFAVITNPFSPKIEQPVIINNASYLITMYLELEDFGNNRYGFSTAEGTTSMLDFTWSMAAIDTRKLDDPSPTPEPATMLLMGMGLAGVGFVKRRKNNKS